MNSMFETIFGLLGGLAVFIFGMNLMSESLQKAAGEKMKKIIGFLTKNPIMGVLAGALATSVLQSSSATTVMVIGFVSAGLMSLPQAISVILGANIGTTMTAQLIAFKISDYIYVFIFVGFVMNFISKNEKIKNIGSTIFAFGLLFTGIETMGGVMKPLASSPVFTSMIEQVAHIPVLGVLVGTLMTLVVQSSSATIAVLQNFASQPAADGVSSMLGLAGAIPILLGDNIGTTITAILASVGQSKDSKRTAISHCIFNVSGSLIFIWLVKPYAALIQMISPKGPEIEVISRQIANAHTFFNITMTLLWLPFIWLMVKIVMRIIPDGSERVVDNRKPIYLDERLIGQPAASLEMFAREVLHCSEIVMEMLPKTMKVFASRETDTIQEIIDDGYAVNGIHDEIMNYLSNLFSSGALTEEQSAQTAGLMYVLSDVNRMGNLCGQLGECAKEGIEHNYSFSKDAVEEISNSIKTVASNYSKAMDMIKTGSAYDNENTADKRARVTSMDINLRRNHMERVSRGECNFMLTAPFTKILNIIDRMGNSCINIADAVASSVNIKYFVPDEGLK